MVKNAANLEAAVAPCKPLIDESKADALRQTIRLSPMDVRMRAYSFRVVCIFPPTANGDDGSMSYNAHRLE
uniref:Uncharacterized protein n=1 Tax=Globisporangium ultimum (strain ATCC 200006 / CBS 805.95 / DAOM BR144) TaxID=431595 RepID=K3W5S7_GLOUD